MHQHSEKTFFIIVLLFIFLSVFSVTTLPAQNRQKHLEDKRVEDVVFDNGKETPTLIQFKRGNGQGYKPEQSMEILKKHLFLRDKIDALIFEKTSETKGELEYSRYRQYYKNIRVESGDFVVVTKQGEIDHVTGNYIPNLNLDTKPPLSEAEAFQKALDIIKADQYMWEDQKEENWLKSEENNPNATFKPKGELVIIENYSGKNENRLAYKFNVYAKKPVSRDWIYIDAQNGMLLLKNPIIKHVNANGSADTKYAGTRTVTTDYTGSFYRLRETNRLTNGITGNGVETYNCQTGTSYAGAVDFTDSDNNWTSAEYDNANYDNAALDAHWGAEMTFDYFADVNNRNSYDGAGATIKNYVHYDVAYDNAYWNGSVMTYGDGSQSFFTALTSLDVAAHEIGHAIMSNEADLTYQGESGALNEGFSDIWGAAVENYAEPTKQRWHIGEDITVTTPSLRDMSNPNREEQPDTYGGQYWAPTGMADPDQGGVHTNSGVLNFWTYLVSDGGSGVNDIGNAYTVNGIGIQKASAIAYNTLLAMTSSNNYANCRTISIAQTQLLYGACSYEVIAMTNAWYAVGVGAAFTNTCRNRDVELISINEPTDDATYCSGNFTPEIRVKNNGSTTVTSMQIDYDVDGGSATNFNWAGSLAAGAYLDITLNNFAGVSTGNHTLNATISQVNGSAHPNINGDNLNSSSKAFSVSSGTAFPYFQDFESGDASLSDFTVITNAESTINIISDAGNASSNGLLMDGNSANQWTDPTSATAFTTNAQHFSSTSICIDATSATDLQLQFDLKQLYSTNNNWTNFRVTINGTQAGAVLQPNGSTTDWQTYIYDLTSYVGSVITISFESNCKYTYYASSGTTANFVDNVSITEKIFDDAALTSVASSYCGGYITPEVVISNLGWNTLTSATISYQIDAGTINTYNWTGSLVTSATEIVTLPSIANASGVYTINMTSSIPNGNADERTANDNASSSFTYNNVGLPFAQDFETGIIAINDFKVLENSQSNIEINADAAKNGSFGILIEGNSSVGYPAPGSGPSEADGFNNTAHPHYGALSFCFDAANAASASLIFDYFLNYGINNAYTNFRYKIEGNGTSFTSPVINPAGSDKNWTNVIFDLTPYVGDIITVTFEGNSKFTHANLNGVAADGNAVYIDNISVTYVSNVPEITFASTVTPITESTVSGSGCRPYQDVTVTMQIANPPTGDALITISSNALNTTAHSPADYEITTPMPITFVNGLSANQTFNVRVYDDATVESLETLELEYAISGTTDAVSGTGNQKHTINITDNDTDPTGGGTTVVFSENFESGLGSWTNTTFNAALDNTNQWRVGTQAVLSGTQSAYVSSANNTGNYMNNKISNALLISPAINAGGRYNMTLDFIYKCNGEISGGTYYDYGRLYYSLDGTNFTSFTSQIQGVTILSNYTVNLPVEVENQTFYLGFLWVNDGTVGNNPAFQIDDVIVNSSGKDVETVLETDTQYLGPNATVYFYSSGGKIISKIENTSNHDYGCTSVSIDRAGTNTTEFWGAATTEYMMDKTVMVTPANNNATGTYNIALYYTATEVDNWMTATGKTTAELKLAKASQAISTINSATPATYNGELGTNNLTALFGSDYSITSSFTTGFSGFAAGDPGPAPTPLPLTLLSFNAKNAGKNIELNWTSAAEENTDYIEIEHSTEGRVFEIIGRINAAGNSTTQIDYNFLHKNVAYGNHFYRLKTIDLDKSFEYSWVESAFQSLSNFELVSLFPNPTSNIININFNGDNETDTEINLINIFGQKMYVKNMATHIGINNIIIDDGNLKNGTYLLAIKNAGRTIRHRIVISQ